MKKKKFWLILTVLALVAGAIGFYYKSNEVQIIEVELPATDPFWGEIESYVEPSFSQYKTNSEQQALMAGTGDQILLALLASLSKAGCTTARWVFNHLVAEKAWRIGRAGGLLAIAKLVQDMANQKVQFVGASLAGNYGRVALWFRHQGQDKMIIISKEGWSTMFPLGRSDLHNIGKPVLDGVGVFRNIVGYNPATGEISGFIMINSEPNIWKPVLGELTIGAMTLTTSVAVATVFLRDFGICLKQEFDARYHNQAEWQEAKRKAEADNSSFGLGGFSLPTLIPGLVAVFVLLMLLLRSSRRRSFAQ